MFLRRLVLENVRSLEYLELSFDAPPEEPKVGAGAKSLSLAPGNPRTRKWTMILGENGTGKSSVLKSIALLIAGSDALSSLVVNPDAWIRNGKKFCRMSADVVTVDNEARHIELTLQRGDSISSIFRRNRKTLEQLDAALAHAERNYFTIGYGVSRRQSSDQPSPRSGRPRYSNPRADAVATLFSSDAVLNSLETWAMDLDYRVKGGIKLVREALDGLLPDVTFREIDKSSRQLKFDTPDGIVPLGQLSDGYQNVAAWCGDLLYRVTETFAERKNPLGARGLLLIDEIGLHLHPIWKRQLVQYLTDKLLNFQVICTTHSALTVHQAGEGELFFLDRPTKKASPVLRHYEGNPSTLMLHQLLVSPLFGLETAYSKPVEEKRMEYRRLKAQPASKLDETDRRTMRRLAGEIAELPTWGEASPHQKWETRIFTKLEKALEGTTVGNGNGAARSMSSASKSGSTSPRSGAGETSGVSKVGLQRSGGATSGGSRAVAAKSGNAKSASSKLGVAKSGGSKSGASKPGPSKSGGTRSLGSKSGSSSSRATKGGRK